MSSRRRRIALFVVALSALAVLGIAWPTMIMLHAVRQQAAVQSALRGGGKIYYDFQIDPSGNPIPDATSPQRGWASAVFSEHVLHTPVRAEIGFQLGVGVRSGMRDYHVSPDAWSAIEQMKGLRWLVLSGTDVTERELLQLRCLRELRALDLTDT